MNAISSQQQEHVDTFNANVKIDGIFLNVHTTNFTDLVKTLAQLGHGVTLEHLQLKQPEAPPAAPKPEPQASASPAPAASPAPMTPAPSPAAASSADAGAKRPDYNDVKAAVLALVKVDKKLAVDTLKAFGVDNANKLKLEDYASFLAAAAKAQQSLATV